MNISKPLIVFMSFMDNKVLSWQNLIFDMFPFRFLFLLGVV